MLLNFSSQPSWGICFNLIYWIASSEYVGFLFYCLFVFLLKRWGSRRGVTHEAFHEEKEKPLKKKKKDKMRRKRRVWGDKRRRRPGLPLTAPQALPPPRSLHKMAARRGRGSGSEATKWRRAESGGKDGRGAVWAQRRALILWESPPGGRRKRCG